MERGLMDESQKFGELFNRGHAHSVEVYRNGQLVGGLYGLSFGRAFWRIYVQRKPNTSS